MKFPHAALSTAQVSLVGSRHQLPSVSGRSADMPCPFPNYPSNSCCNGCWVLHHSSYMASLTLLACAVWLTVVVTVFILLFRGKQGVLQSLG
jgi:hypothetical protein